MNQVNGGKCSFQLSSFSELLLNDQYLFFCAVDTGGEAMTAYRIMYFVNWCGVSVIFLFFFS